MYAPKPTPEIVAALEAARVRLADLRLREAQRPGSTLSAGTLRQIDAALADPAARVPLLARLARLAGASAEGEPLRDAFAACARALGDRLPAPEDGYPPLDPESSASSASPAPESSSASSEAAAGSSGEAASAEDSSEERAVEQEEELEREEVRWWLEDAADELSEEAGWRADAADELSEETGWRADAADELSEEAGRQEDADEPSEEAGRRAGAAGEMSEMSEEAAPGERAASEEEDSLDALLGFVVAVPPPLAPAPPPDSGRKKARRYGPRETAAAVRAAEARLGELDPSDAQQGADARAALAAAMAGLASFEEEDARQKAARFELGTVLETYRRVAGDRSARCELALRSEAHLALCKAGRAGPAATRGLIAELRARLDALVGERPDLKRKRDELDALGEIRAEQRSTAEVIDRGAFARLAREVGNDCREDFRISGNALGALQAAAEDYLVGLLKAGGRASVHAGRTFLGVEDIRLALDLRGEL